MRKNKEKTAAEQARLEEEQRKAAEEQARLEEERRKAIGEVQTETLPLPDAEPAPLDVIEMQIVSIPLPAGMKTVSSLPVTVTGSDYFIHPEKYTSRAEAPEIHHPAVAAYDTRGVYIGIECNDRFVSPEIQAYLAENISIGEVVRY